MLRPDLRSSPAPPYSLPLHWQWHLPVSHIRFQKMQRRQILRRSYQELFLISSILILWTAHTWLLPAYVRLLFLLGILQRSVIRNIWWQFRKYRITSTTVPRPVLQEQLPFPHPRYYRFRLWLPARWSVLRSLKLHLLRPGPSVRTA